MDTTEALEPAANRQLFKRSFALYRASIPGVYIFALMLSITIFIPRLLSVLVGQDIFANLPPLSLSQLWLVVINLTMFLFFIGLIWHIHCTMRGVHEPIAEDFIVGIKKVLLAFIASIIEGVIVVGFAAIMAGSQILLHHYNLLFSGGMLGIVFTGGIFLGEFLLFLYIFTIFIFFVPLIAIENNGIWKALERSALLVWNHWWRVFSLQITPWICYILVLFFIRCVLGVDIHIYLTNYTPHGIWPTLLHICLFTLFIPWSTALLIVQLKDLEVRKQIAKRA